jgi:Fur family ferric uptake transcriptional regulator
VYYLSPLDIVRQQKTGIAPTREIKMSEIHLYERRQFEKLFKEEKIDRFDDRFKVLEAFLQKEEHVSAAELTAVLNDQKISLSPEFVEDTLELMCRFGFAQKNRFENGIARYEHRHLGQHHDHMICTKCGKILEFENDSLERLQAQIASEYGFHMLQHRMEIYGICSDCMKTRESQMPLVAAKQGEHVVIAEFSGGSQGRLRLNSMGLRVGDALEVISNQGQGQVVVAAGFQRYVLGRGMSQKIIVCPARE